MRISIAPARPPARRSPPRRPNLGRYPFEQRRVHLSRRQIGSPRVRRTSPPGRDGVGDPLIFIRMIHFAATLSLAGAVIFGAAIAGPVMRQMGGAGAALRARLMSIAWWRFAVAVGAGVGWTGGL